MRVFKHTHATRTHIYSLVVSNSYASVYLSIQTHKNVCTHNVCMIVCTYIQPINIIIYSYLRVHVHVYVPTCTSEFLS